MSPRRAAGSFEKKGNSRAVTSKKSAKNEHQDVSFQSELALEILEELYPLLLANCTDDDDEIDAQAVFEVLAGLVGFFRADYAGNFGKEKAAAALVDLQVLAQEIYQARLEANQDE